MAHHEPYVQVGKEEKQPPSERSYDRIQNRFSKETQFKGCREESLGHFYDCSDLFQSAHFMTTTKKISGLRFTDW